MSAPAPASPLAIPAGVGDALHALRAVITGADRYRHAAAASLGLNVTDTYALSNLNLIGPMTQTELAGRVGITRGASTVMIDRLENADLARRTPHRSDRRVTLVELTDHGTAILAASAARLATVLPLEDEADLDQTTTILRIIATRLDLLADEPAVPWPPK